MIKKILVVCSLLFSLSVSSENRPWTAEERAWGWAAGAMLVGDWLTTRNMTQRYNEGYYERNPVLGSHPTTAQVNRHFAIAVPVVFLVADNWQSQRKHWLMGVTIIEAAMVANNLSIGLRIQY